MPSEDPKYSTINFSGHISCSGVSTQADLAALVGNFLPTSLKEQLYCLFSIHQRDLIYPDTQKERIRRSTVPTPLLHSRLGFCDSVP